MSYILDVYYPRPEGVEREVRISEFAAQHGGRVYGKHTDLPDGHLEDDPPTPVWLRFEFDDFDLATVCQKEMLKSGEWAEPPSDIGD